MEFSKTYREIEKALKELLPEQITAEWADKAVGKARWKQDVQALTSALSKPIGDFLSRGGKRWRPMLMLICCEAVGGKPADVIPFTVIPELIHNGTLIADDVEDNSDLRRGKPALHKIFGMDVALNAGNTLYFLPSIIIRDSALPDTIKQKAYEIINTQLLKCHFGQAMDIWWHKNTEIPTEEHYLQMCASKSGSLAAMAAQLGALLGGGNAQQIEALGRFAETTGAAFQIQDDILNISQSLGKEYGEDITEGKRTLLIIHTIRAAPEQEKLRLLEILNMHAKDKKLLNEAITIITKHGAIEHAKKTATALGEQALNDIETITESEAKGQLKELAKFLINRTF